MPFVPNTPESLVKRTDSKNPNTTCGGVTGGGRPCRRPLSSDGSSKPKPKPKPKGKLAVIDPSDPSRYCWQHKDQAVASTHSSPGPQIHNTPILEGRTSIDSLTGRLGLLQTSQSPGKPSRPQKPDSGRPSYNGGGISPEPSNTYSRPSKKLKEFSFCCFRIPLYFEDPTPPPRPHPTPVQQVPTAFGRPNRPSSNNHLSVSHAYPNQPSMTSHTPSQNSHISQTSQYLSLIPPDAPPETASKLITELAKPVSKRDEEGYIYIFWLTPESEASSAPAANARSLLEPTARSLEPTGAANNNNNNSRPARGRDRRPSDVLKSFADAAGSVGTRSPTTTRSRGLSSGDDKTTLLLKIGRANNVQRRMNEWKRQCGYDLSLIRYYPYVQSGSGVEPRKMPHSHKVERLIHLELGGLGLRIADRGTCEACGREHKEWFEVEATKDGIMRVDEAIRRWVDWDEGMGTA